MSAMVLQRPPWFILFLQSASMVIVFCVTNVLIPTLLRMGVKLKWGNSHFLRLVAWYILQHTHTSGTKMNGLKNNHVVTACLQAASPAPKIEPKKRTFFSTPQTSVQAASQNPKNGVDTCKIAA